MRKVLFYLIIILLSCLPDACHSGKKQQQEKDTFVQIKLEHHPESKRVDVIAGKNLFTSYLYTDTLEKPVLFPVIAAGGITVTRGYPIDPREGETADHPHHTGFWFTYGNVNGIDFWGNSREIPASEKSGYGTLRFRGIEKMEIIRERGILSVNHDWVNPDGTVPLKENSTFLFSAGDDYRIIDRITVLTAQLPEVSFYDTKEGAFAIRVAEFLEFPSDKPSSYIDAYGKVDSIPEQNNEGANGNYLSSDGIEGAMVWGKRARWMKLYGKHGSDTLSVVIMDHPSNLNYPTFWHAREYGLFSANPFGQKDFTEGDEVLDFRLKKRETITFKHRLYIKSGNDFSTSEIENNWRLFRDSTR